MTSLSSANSATAVTNQNWFVYEDLLTRVQNIQNQVIQTSKLLDNHWESQKKKQHELKSRSFTFIDPYGNRTTVQCMDHESMTTIVKKYKKNYVPKYLQKWVKIGTPKNNGVTPLKPCDLLRTVSEYTEGSIFYACGEVIVWAKESKYTINMKLTDNMAAVKLELQKCRLFKEVEFESIIVENGNQLTANDTNEATPLKLEDTILSAQLYQDNHCILAKIIDYSVEKKNIFLSKIFLYCFHRSMIQMIPTIGPLR